MAIVDGFHYWLLMQPGESSGAAGVIAAPISTEVA
jgi:hypothetical protein